MPFCVDNGTHLGIRRFVIFRPTFSFPECGKSVRKIFHHASNYVVFDIRFFYSYNIQVLYVRMTLLSRLITYKTAATKEHEEGQDTSTKRKKRNGMEL